MSLLPETMTYFREQNFPPETGRKPICPYYQLIEICAKLANVKINKEKFCGSWDQTGIRRPDLDKGPRSECTEIWKKLQGDMVVAEMKINLQTEAEIEKSLEKLGLDKKRDELNKWHNLKTTKEEQGKIIVRWRGILQEISLGKIDGEKRCFGGIEKPEDLTDKQVITYVQGFLSNLQKIANRYGWEGFYMRDKDREQGKTAEQCPQIPKDYGLHVWH